MSYAKMMKSHKNPRKYKKCQPILMGFVNPDPDYPSLGGCWYEAGMDAERAAHIISWRKSRGKICYECETESNLNDYHGIFKLCGSCQLTYKLRSIVVETESQIKELENINSNKRLSKRIIKVKETIKALIKKYTELGGSINIPLPSCMIEQPTLF